MAKAKTFSVQVKVDAFVDVPVQASNLADAVERANALRVEDVVTFASGTSLNDDNIRITGIYEG